MDPAPRPGFNRFHAGCVAFFLAGVALFFLYVEQPRYRVAAVGLFLLQPWAVLAFGHRARGAVVVGATRRDSRAHAEVALFPPLAFALLALTLDWPLLDWRGIVPVWVAGSLLTLAAFVLVVRRTQKCSYGAYSSLALLAALYGGVLARFIDCGLDPSAGVSAEVRVLERHKSAGGRYGPNYYLQLAPFPGAPAGRDLGVKSAFYSRHPVGSTVEVVLHPGTLNVAWFQLR